jgi:hypothetical protein
MVTIKFLSLVPPVVAVKEVISTVNVPPTNFPPLKVKAPSSDLQYHHILQLLLPTQLIALVEASIFLFVQQLML